MGKLVATDASGHLFCAKCGTKTNADLVPFKNLQAVVAHLQYCGGPEQLRARMAEIAARVAAPSPPLPVHPPVQQHAGPAPLASTLGALGARWSPAQTRVFPLFHANERADARREDARVLELQAENERLKDELLVVERERDEFKNYTVDLLKTSTNDLVHLGEVATAATSGPSTMVVVVAITAVGLLGAWALGAFDKGDRNQKTVSMGGTREPDPPSRPSASSLGTILDLVGKGARTYKSLRGIL